MKITVTKTVPDDYFGTHDKIEIANFLMEDMAEFFDEVVFDIEFDGVKP